MTFVSTFRPIAAAVALLAAGSSQASIQVFTDEASFLAALSGYIAATDSFDDLVPAQSYSGPLGRSAGSIGYTASTAPGSPVLYGAGTPGDAWLSSNNASDFILFDGFSAPVHAVGAYVFGSDIAGDFSATGLTAVRVTNASAEQSTQFTLRAATSNYYGFLSDSPISLFEVKTFYRQSNITWPTVNDLTLAAPVPEPGAWALMALGLSALARARRRRAPA